MRHTDLARDGVCSMERSLGIRPTFSGAGSHRCANVGGGFRDEISVRGVVRISASPCGRVDDLERPAFRHRVERVAVVGTEPKAHMIATWNKGREHDADVDRSGPDRGWDEGLGRRHGLHQCHSRRVSYIDRQERRRVTARAFDCDSDVERMARLLAVQNDRDIFDLEGGRGQVSRAEPGVTVCCAAGEITGDALVHRAGIGD